MKGCPRVFAMAVVACAAACGPKASDPAANPVGPKAAFAMVDVTEASGVTFVSRSGEEQRYIPEAKGAGVTMFDYDDDGVLDLLFLAGSTLARERSGEPGFGAALYRGLGGLRYEDVTSRSGLPPLAWTYAAAAGDADGNGCDDLLVTGLSGARLLLNDRGSFRDAPAGALPESARRGGWCTSATFVDFDRDGDLDLFIARYAEFDLAHPPEDGKDGRTCRWKGHAVICGPRGLPPLRDLLLRNRGDGVYEDVTTAFGIDRAAPAYGLGVLLLDVNRDGCPDLYVANDMTPSHLWRNDGDRFTECAIALGIAYSADGAPEAGMGIDAGDVDGDGLDDILKTNFEGEPNDLYRASEKAGFVESSTRAGTAPPDRPHVGWGCAIRDFDGDGVADLFVANGHVYPQATLPSTGATYAQPKVLHLGTPSGRFTRFKGKGAAALDVPAVSRGAAFGDLDDDGDVDVVVANLNARPTILRNDAPGGPWVGVRVIGPRGNPHAIGAVVTLRGPGLVRGMTIRAQASFMSTNDPRVLFRLPGGSRLDSMDIELPGRPRAHVAPVPMSTYATMRIE